MPKKKKILVGYTFKQWKHFFEYDNSGWIDFPETRKTLKVFTIVPKDIITKIRITIEEVL